MLTSVERIPPISEAERTPLVLTLLELIQLQREEIQQLRDELTRLKGHKTKPDIKPSQLTTARPLEGEAPSEQGDKPGKRPGSAKRDKTAQLTIQKTERIRPTELPPGSIFKGYQTYVVQDLRIELANTLYLLERWLTPDGHWLMGTLSAAVRAGGHFGPGLKSLVLYQHHDQRVAQSRILAFLWDAGIDISSGQVNRLLLENHEGFHAEKDQLLAVGLALSPYVHADDTAARHRGQNGYTTHIGNEYFAWFATTESKSRINFLQLLRAGAQDYCLTADAFALLREHKLTQEILDRLQQSATRTFANEAAWKQHLNALGIVDERHCRMVTEAALLGSVLSHGMRRDLVVVSDDAGQFDIWLHALCWVHAERNINKLVPLSDLQRTDLETVRGELWQLYFDLKAYKANPVSTQKSALAARFDALCRRKTCFAMLNQALKRLYRNKAELLLVLDRADLPLHNNLSEQDIRDYVIKRKISGGTRSDAGRRCRDTFTSLMKTCRKLGLSFWSYLRDRLTGEHAIAALPDLVRQKAAGKGEPAKIQTIATTTPEPNAQKAFAFA